MKKPTKLPDLSLIEANFTYDPTTGLLYRKSGIPVNANDRSTGQMKVRVGRKTVSVQRVCWYLYYRKDPLHYQITHINGNPRDNRIENLRAVKMPKSS